MYENNGDIIFKRINAKTHEIFYDINLTDNEPAVCKNPTINGGGYATPYMVTYQRQKPDGNWAIDCRKTDANFVWSGDTISVTGNNINPRNHSGFVSDIIVTYESNKNGKYNIFGYDTYQNYYFTLISDMNFNYSNLENYMYPLITTTPAVVYTLFGCSLKQTNDGMKLLFCYNFPYFKDSVLISDTMHKPVVTMGNGVKPSSSVWYNMVWTVFNKDSAGVSMLYAYGKKINFSAIKQSGTEIPGAYALHQNYPNPFNPSTKINFALPKENNVTLKVYDLLGREVAVLVNQVIQAGNYSIDFNAGNLSGGVYFYKLEAGTYSEVKKMMVIK